MKNKKRRKTREKRQKGKLTRKLSNLEQIRFIFTIIDQIMDSTRIHKFC